MIHIHDLDGCAPAPLAHYLKALGILRLVAEQADSGARGWWHGDRFQLGTKLNRRELEEFFLDDYQPTPIFNPWGARSGYFDGGSEKSARESLGQIERSKQCRMKPFRNAIEIVRSVVGEATPGGKPSDKEKDRLILALRLNARGTSSLWLDTVVAVISAGDDVSLVQPPIFGTGGSEGSGSYTSAYMSAIVEAIIKNKWNHAVHTALFGESEWNCDWKQSMGQFSPGRASTPWDMLFAFEGACVLRSSVGGRTSTNSRKWMSSPFYVAPRSAGYASGSRLDEKFLNKGREHPGRGEQWLPMWARPSEFSEVQQVFLQGRAATRLGRATDGWTMARAVAGFGVSRGIPEFIRYGYQQRNNQATHFAIPLGRFRVPDERAATSSCLDDLDQWLPSLHRLAHPTDDKKSKQAPARLTIAYGRLNDELFAVLRGPPAARQWQDALVRLGDVEAVMRGGSGFLAQPVPSLRPEWVVASHDGTPEFRLALAFALQSCAYRVGGRRVEDPIRRHWLPLDRDRPWRFATTSTGTTARLEVSPEVVMHGRRGIDDAIALVERRLVEASQREGRYLPLKAATHASAGAADLANLLSGGVNLDRTVTLARALMALDQKAWADRHISMESPRASDWPDDAWLAIRLCVLPWPLETRSGFRLDVGADPALVRRLAAGDAATAVHIALQRLRAAGVRCTLRGATASRATARLWAAALAFPITKRTAEWFLHRLDPNLDPNRE